MHSSLVSKRQPTPTFFMAFELARGNTCLLSFLCRRWQSSPIPRYVMLSYLPGYSSVNNGSSVWRSSGLCPLFTILSQSCARDKGSCSWSAWDRSTFLASSTQPSPAIRDKTLESRVAPMFSTPSMVLRGYIGQYRTTNRFTASFYSLSIFSPFPFRFAQHSAVCRGAPHYLFAHLEPWYLTRSPDQWHLSACLSSRWRSANFRPIVWTFIAMRLFL